MKTIIERSKFAVAVALAALAAVSCAKDLGGSPSSSGGQDEGNITSGRPSAGARTAGPSSVSNVGTQVALPTGTRPETAPVPGIEMPATPPSPAVLRAVSAVQEKLNGLVSGVDGTRVRFVDCSETAACTARLEGQSLAGLRDLLQAVSQQHGGIDYVVREQLDGYAGRTFVADVTLAATASRVVPTDENALLAN
ncbi:MAG TPA: hypothetical protein VGK52_02795 [Polyangia bacterium]|jgi:hypothetical protein